MAEINKNHFSNEEDMQNFGIFLLTENLHNDIFCVHLVKAIFGDVESAKKISNHTNRLLGVYKYLNNREKDHEK